MTPGGVLLLCSVTRIRLRWAGGEAAWDLDGSLNQSVLRPQRPFAAAESCRSRMTAFQVRDGSSGPVRRRPAFAVAAVRRILPFLNRESTNRSLGTSPRPTADARRLPKPAIWATVALRNLPSGRFTLLGHSGHRTPSSEWQVSASQRTLGPTWHRTSAPNPANANCRPKAAIGGFNAPTAGYREERSLCLQEVRGDSS